MKKIKLLMPILGLSSIATIAIPLTSCNSKGNDGKVTDTELTAALNALNDVNTRNYTVDTNTTYTTTEGSITINYKYLAEGTALSTSSTSSSIEVDEAEISAYGARWNINNDTSDEKWRVDHILGSNESLIQQTYLFMAFNEFMTKGKKVQDLTFDATDKTYIYLDTIAIEELNMPFTLKFKFNEQKQIATADFKFNDGSVTMTGNFFDYGTTTVPTSIKQASPVNLFEATESTVNGTATQLKTTEHDVYKYQDFAYFYVCDLNKFDTSITVPVLSATTHQGNKFNESKTYLYKLGNTISTLKKDTDYSFDGGNQIDLEDSGNIKMTDTLVFEIGYTGVTEATKMDYFILE